MNRWKPRNAAIWKRTLSAWVLVGCSVLILGSAAGCGDSGPSQEVQSARQALQRGRAQEAIDLLAQETSAEGYYLKAVALDYLRMSDDAREHIRMARAADPKATKYHAYELRLRLYDGSTDVADELLQLYRDHRTSPVAALGAFYAHEAYKVVRMSGRQTDEALKQHEAAIAALKTAIALNAQIPEFQREMLNLVIGLQLADQVDPLLEKLREAAPNDPQLKKERIAALLLANRKEDAVGEARALYFEKGRTEEAALVFADALATALASEQRDRDFHELRSRFPDNLRILNLYAVYLTRSNRVFQACDELAAAINKQPSKSIRQELMYVAIDLPLEVRNADLAEEQLGHYQSRISDPTMITYFEGRLDFLRKDHNAALEKMRQVVEAQKDAVGSDRALAGEALTWMQRILADRAVSQQLQKTSDAVRDKKPGDSESPTESPIEPESDSETPSTPATNSETPSEAE